jgi:3-isopropylmalate/(R)-2-methylmalate dehydratase small subunit
MLWKFGDNINTDFITPGRYNLTTDAAKLGKIAFIEFRPEFCEDAKEGDVIAAGDNFGCGSSRETAVVALKARGIRAVIAKSFARIFYRNAINVGLPLIVADTSQFEDGDEVSVDFENNRVLNKTRNIELEFESDRLTKRILAEGGIIPYLKKNGLDSLGRLSE